MAFDRLNPRSEYYDRLKQLNGECSFCRLDVDTNLYIKEYANWKWKFSAFPYKKYHTLLSPKRHILHFSELESNEIIELQSILKEIEMFYKSSGLIVNNSAHGNQLFVHWKIKFENQDDAVAHFHINLYPRFGEGRDIVMDKQAHDIDMALLKNK